MRFRSLLLFAILSASVSFVACADLSGWMRRRTYPPDFHYISQEQLRSTMWQLAHHVRELDRILRGPDSAGGRGRDEIIKLLVGMEGAVDQLGRQGWPSNHPLMDANLGILQRDIALARAAAQRDPPNYIQAGLLAGACVYCHS